MSASRPARLGALQIGSSPEGTAATLERILEHEAAICDEALDVLVLPEALLGGYPKGADFGDRVGYRTDRGREQYPDYWSQAIEVAGPEVQRLCALARHAGTAVVVGMVERDGATLYCTALLIDSAGALVGHHRKLVPTGSRP